MDLLEFARQYPAPPPIGRSDEAHYANLRFTKKEYQAAVRLIDIPETESMFNGTFQGLMRWSFYYVAYSLAELIEAGKFKPLAFMLQENLGAYNSMLRIDETKEFVNTKALQIASLKDLPNEALKVYAETLEFAHNQGYPVDKLIVSSLNRHPEIIKFRQEQFIADPDRLRNIESRYHDE